MDLAHPEFLPDPALSRSEMETLQREVAGTANFSDDVTFDPKTVTLNENGDDGQTRLGAESEEAPLVVGVDQAFLDDRAVSAVVAMQNGTVIERVHAVTDLSIPYIPGLLSFREGGPILAAFDELSAEPDLALFDGSGRIHFRQAGLATHLGVILDLPSVGVAKSLLCGRSRGSTDELPAGARVAIEADERVDASPGTVLGYAYQSRQYSESKRINPLYVSPGHRVSAETATDLVARLCGEYKLPEPTRLADAYADEAKELVQE